MSLKDKSAVVTGGSRGLGLGLVEALVAHGARVTVVARGAEALDSVRARLGVATISADITDETAAHRILAELRPDILALNALAAPIDAAADVVDSAQPDPLEMLMRKDAVKTAVSRFVELPTLQRSVVILKDVLDESLIEIAALLDLTVDAVKGHLARGRAHLREINAHGRPLPDARPASAAVARYVALFNDRNWDGLRALLADDVKLHQSLHPLRVGRADVGLFFTLYAKIDGVSLAPAWLEGREVIAVFEDPADPKPSYVMWLEWRDGRISFIRDYRYVRYVTADAELTLAPEIKPADDGAAQ
jgi:hypothetical protein